MSNLTITNNDTGSVIFEGGTYEDETLTFGALVAGSITDTTTYAVTDQDGLTEKFSIDGGATQTVTFAGATTTALQVAAQINDGLVGASATVTGGQVVVTSDLTGDQSSVAIVAGGTGGLTWDTAVAGTGTLTALEGTILARDSSSLKLVMFVKGGSTNENGIPKAVLTYDASIAAAGDLPIRAMHDGKVIKSHLIIAADGDATNVDKKVLDQLRDYALISVTVTELNSLDNQ